MTKEMPTGPDLTRVINNFFREGTKDQYQAGDVETIRVFLEEHLAKKDNTSLKKHKVALLFICLNPHYWGYIKPVVDGARKFFLPGHNVDMFCWSDLPLTKKDSAKISAAREYIVSETQRVRQELTSGQVNSDKMNVLLSSMDELVALENDYHGMTMFDSEPVAWPLPTLMRYHLFLQQEEILKDYDYVFYCDVDMKFVNYVGDEILGEGLTAAQHPMYALKKEYWPPYEPNADSASYIPRPGRVISDEGKRRFMPLYFAGGFVGGRTKDFLEACKEMKKLVDDDFAKDYTPIWNDESVLNKYLFEHPPAVVLSPSYVYPDTLINEYYVKLWGRNYSPKIITLTKPFTLNKEGGEFVNKIMERP